MIELRKQILFYLKPEIKTNTKKNVKLNKDPYIYNGIHFS